MYIENLLNDRVRVLLNDTDSGGIRWTDGELIDWYNEAVSEVVRMKPEAGAVTDIQTLTAGTKQSLPSGASRILAVIRNQNGVGNADAGRVIRLIDRATLDNERPNWHTETGVAEVLRYVFDENDPKVFYVYPPADGSTGVLINYSSAPTPVTAAQVDNSGNSGAEFQIDTIYAAAVANYICYRAHTKNLLDANSKQHAAEFYNLFTNAISVLDATDKSNDPNMKSTGFGA